MDKSSFKLGFLIVNIFGSEHHLFPGMKHILYLFVLETFNLDIKGDDICQDMLAINLGNKDSGNSFIKLVLDVKPRFQAEYFKIIPDIVFLRSIFKPNMFM